MSFPWAKHYEPKQPLMRWLDEKLPVPRLVYNAVGAGYPVPRNLNYFWNFGVLAGAALGIQIITGIVLAMHYHVSATGAFDSVEAIMRDVRGGWFLRYAHANGASMFFIVVYTHIFRGLYYGSYKAPREMVWLLGVVIFLLMMATAFMGYVLPWGQMSFWGAQVITGFFSAIPLVGETVRVWLLGGYAPDDAALNRFFALHYLLPFVIAAVIVLHIWALHIPGSNNPTGVDVKGEQDTVPFHPYYTAKDGFGLGHLPAGVCGAAVLLPQLSRPPGTTTSRRTRSRRRRTSCRNGNFWPFYAILRSFTADFILPAKLWGVLAMFGSILLLFFLPWLDSSPIRSNNYRPKARIAFWVLVADVLVLGWVGGSEATPTLCDPGADHRRLLFRALPDRAADHRPVGAAAAVAALDHRGGAGQAWRDQPRPDGAGVTGAGVNGTTRGV